MEKFRKEIDKIDSEIAKLLEKRFEICSEIGDFKSKNNIETEDKSREKKIIEKIERTDLKYRDNIKEVESKILLESKKIQDNLK
ncbi:MAG: chorismate mutase [Finegoldia magna]|uniref:chorismate mutase n=1 Tax=Finegoldia magna TaxID=1260 RepID=UPI0026ED0951|nr:chorismate mutase [Finegoldia magna]MBS5941962.1 chorismate mutase [Finegoldia magna]MDU4277638.1 chorismate mutase [Finegoldia magna]MDU5700268.1 chorismate mutase [Finegoldia magna]